MFYGKIKHTKIKTYPNLKECIKVKNSMVEELNNNGYHVNDYGDLSATCSDEYAGKSLSINIWPHLD